MAPAQKDEAVMATTGLSYVGEVNPIIVLKELFELLEEYGPAWYTQEMHDRAFAALMRSGIQKKARIHSE